MRVKAWQCDHCGMLTPGEDETIPDEWLSMAFEYQGKQHVSEVCSPPCASKMFKGLDTKKPRKTSQKAAQKPLMADGKHVCPECGKPYNMPQHLGMHRKRAHGVESERDRLQRKG